MIDFEKDQSTTIEGAHQTIKNSLSEIELFLRHYVNDVGMMIQVIDASVCRFVGGEMPAEKLDDLLYKSRKDTLVGARMDSTDFDAYNAAVLAAPSFEFLVRYFRILSEERPGVMPLDCIPSNEVVHAALALFHDSLKQKVALSMKPAVPDRMY